MSVKEGDSLSLICKVNGGQGPLSVTWQRKATSTPTAALTTVISQKQDGVTEKGPEFASRHVRAARPATDTFTLELDKVAPSDAAVYLCVVSAWTSNSKPISHSNASTVTVAPTGELGLHLCGTNPSLQNNSCGLRPVPSASSGASSQSARLFQGPSSSSGSLGETAE